MTSGNTRSVARRHEEQRPFDAHAAVVEFARRLDPTKAAMSDMGLAGFAKHPIITAAVTIVTAGAPLHLLSVHAEIQERIRGVVNAAAFLSEHGWTLSKYTPEAAYVRTLELYQGGASTEDIDNVLIAAWNESNALDVLAARIGTLGAGDATTRAVGTGRARLVKLALEHHRDGAFEASIPILLAQIDGITRDATATEDRPKGRSFFSKPNSDDAFVDDATIAGMAIGLPAVRGWFSADELTSGLHGGGSRHGILHGRDVAYDTITTSTKCVALLVAVWEWANPRLAAIADAAIAARYHFHAGSDGVDENGWRLDRRGFSSARLVLNLLAFAQHLLFEDTGRYGTWAEAAFRPEFAKQLAAAVTEATGTEPAGRGPGLGAVTVKADGNRWSASVRSESGWVFSIGGHDDTTFYADGPNPLDTFPPGYGWRTDSDGNWSSDCHWTT